MARELLKQEEINTEEPPDFLEVRQITCTLTVVLTNHTPPRLAFRYSSVTVLPLAGDPATPVLNIDVDRDVAIILRLDSSINWRWSGKFAAITTKKPLKKYYGELRYKEGNDWVEETAEDCKEIKFLAALNAPPTSHFRHGFSLNIDLLQPDGMWLPITLDPDIKNPPPDPTFASEYLSAQ